jgi:hypothetical protein
MRYKIQISAAAILSTLFLFLACLFYYSIRQRLAMEDLVVHL